MGPRGYPGWDRVCTRGDTAEHGADVALWALWVRILDFEGRTGTILNQTLLNPPITENPFGFRL